MKIKCDCGKLFDDHEYYNIEKYYLQVHKGIMCPECKNKLNLHLKKLLKKHDN